MRNPNISGDQFAKIPPAVQAAADTVASEVGSSRTYPPRSTNTLAPNDWFVEEGPLNDEDEEGRPAHRVMSMGLDDPRFAGPEEMQAGYLARAEGVSPHEATHEWGISGSSRDHWNAMEDPDLGRGMARHRFQYDSPEWRRRNLRVVR